MFAGRVRNRLRLGVQAAPCGEKDSDDGGREGMDLKALPHECTSQVVIVT